MSLLRCTQGASSPRGTASSKVDIYYYKINHLRATRTLPTTPNSPNHPPCHDVTPYSPYPLFVFSQLPYRTHTAHLATACPAHTAATSPTHPPLRHFPHQPWPPSALPRHLTHHTPGHHVRLYHLFPRDGFPIAARTRSPPLSSLNRARVRRVANVDLPRFEGHSLRSLGHCRQNRPIPHRREAHEGGPLAEHAAIANDDGLRQAQERWT